MELIDRLSRGEHSAFAELYDRYWPSLYTFIHSKINDQEVCEDLLHDLFLSLWKNKNKLTEIQSLEAYLYSSCRYLAIAYIRKASKFEFTTEENSLHIRDPQAPLEDVLHFRFVMDQVSSEIEKLPEKCREVFKLSRQKHLSNLEISKQLGVSESTVENHINKALKRLRLVAKHFMTFLMFF